MPNSGRYWTKAEREALQLLLNAGNRDFGAVHIRKALATVEALERLSNRLTDLMGFVANEAGEVIGVGIDGETVRDSPRFVMAFRELVTLQDELKHGPLAALASDEGASGSVRSTVEGK